tara:strand:+ start:499 stop:921 length:423 start_codon:yes stop_codon:yes gene_type:complete
MKKILLINIIFLTSIVFLNAVENKYFNEGINFFEKKEFKKAKFKFQQDIVRNPKSVNSYLYLSKIFEKENNLELEEMNLNTVLLLNPKNEEAIYNLTLVNLKKSDFKGAKRLINDFKKNCKNLCSQLQTLNTKLENSLKK